MLQDILIRRHEQIEKEENVVSLWCQGGKAREVGSGYSLPGIYGRGWRAMSSIQLQSSLWRVVSGKMSSNLHFKKITLSGVWRMD